MKKILTLISLILSINCYANTGWTTYINNLSNVPLIINDAKSKNLPGYLGAPTFNTGDLESTIIVGPHSMQSFYTEENKARGINKSINYKINNIDVTYQAIPEETSSTKRGGNNEYALVSLNEQFIKTSGTYDSPTGCVTVEVVMSQDNQLYLNSLNYGDHHECSANNKTNKNKQNHATQLSPLTTLPIALKVYENGKDNYEAQVSQDFKLNRNEAIRVIASPQSLQFLAYELYLQTDDNLLVYGCSDTLCTLGSILWSSGSSVREEGANPDSHMIFQKSDGNLVVQNGPNPLWATGTDNKNAAKFALQNDGNFVIYDTSNKPIWDRMSGLVSY